MNGFLFTRQDLRGTAICQWLEADIKTEVEARVAAETRARVKAEDVLIVLRTKGVCLDEAEHSRIADCRDLDLLELWFRRAVVAATADDVFTEPAAADRQLT